MVRFKVPQYIYIYIYSKHEDNHDFDNVIILLNVTNPLTQWDPEECPYSFKISFQTFDLSF